MCPVVYGELLMADHGRLLEREITILTDRIAELEKRANDAWAAAHMERESADYWKAKATEQRINEAAAALASLPIGGDKPAAAGERE